MVSTLVVAIVDYSQGCFDRQPLENPVAGFILDDLSVSAGLSAWNALPDHLKD